MDDMICSICGARIVGDDYEELAEGDIVCSDCVDIHCKECEKCHDLFEVEEMIEEDGDYYCENCHDELFSECEICGSMTPNDELQLWGDLQICPECMEERCPTFDAKENEKETTAAYEKMLKKYIGRKSGNQSGRKIDLEYEFGDETPMRYEISVALDEEGRITDVSRLSASMMLSESLQSADWRPYPIDNDDYEWIVDSMMDKLDLADDETGEA